MSREVRRVPADWKHPRESGRSNMHRPLFEGPWEARAEQWDKDAALFARGLDSQGDPLPVDMKATTFAEWDGDRPEQRDYMPTWTDAEKTHWQMYETTTEGTPISPVCDSPENLARWLADNNASTFASATTDYDTWLRMIGHGQSVGSCLIIGGQMISGVDAAASEG